MAAMAGNRSTFHWQSETLFVNTKRFPLKVERGIIAAVEHQATRSEGYMRSNAKWQDQTGNARAGLHTVVEHSAKEHRIIFAHSVPYGIWLEVRFSGRYAIILPSVQRGGQELMTTLGSLLGRLGT